MIKKCEYCGSKYETDIHNKIYCSRKCCEKAQNDKKRIAKLIARNNKSCEICGKEFFPSDLRMKYCSDECADYAEKRRKNPHTFDELKEIAINKCRELCNSYGLDYVSGYIDTNHPIIVRCMKCGDEWETYQGGMRAGHKPKCKECSRIKAEAEADQREADRQRTIFIKECKPMEYQQITLSFCEICGDLIDGRRKYCTDCARLADNYRKEHRINGKRKSAYTWRILAKIQGDLTCNICGRQCNPEDVYANDDGYMICGNDYPSVDHIIPIAKGGKDELNNLQLACRGCNSRKSDIL